MDVLNQKLSGPGGSLAIDGASKRAGPIARGTYRARVTVDAYVNQGASAVIAAAPVPPAGDEIQPAGKAFWFRVDGDGDAYVAAITGGAAGHLIWKWMAP